jgi:signal transduction histidine kinase/DNA-binding response OmpR family regulator
MNKNGSVLHHFIHESRLSNTLGTDFVYCIIEDSQENIWIGGKRGHLTKYNRKTGAFTQLQMKQPINSFAEINSDSILIASELGIYTLSIKDNTTAACSFNNTLKSKYICDIYKESDTVFWFASYGGGVVRYNKHTNDIRYITKDSGLASNIIYSILPDNQQHLWLSTEAGISKIDISSSAVENYSHYIPAVMSYRQRSRMKTAQGQLFFGAYNGLVYFHPEQIATKHTPVKLFFSDLSLFNRVTKPGEKGSPLQEPLDNVSHISLSYKEHSFSLDFTAIDFTQVGGRRYMWKLDGLDKDWIGPSTENVAHYTNLSPRNYIFRLKAVDENLQVLDERQLAITIRPPVWNTWWAKVLESILILLLIYGIYKYVRYIYDKKRSDEKIRFFITTTHDLRTPLTLISAPLFELKDRLGIDHWNNYLFELITGNLDKLNKMIAQLLDFQKAYEQEDQLVLNQRELAPYLTEKVMYWKPVALKKEINLELECPPAFLAEWFDVEKMDKVLDNLLSNAIKYTPSQGQVKVNLTYATQYWQITVSDSGIGIPKSDVKKMFQRFYRAENAVNSQESGSGLGLLLVKNYITLHGGQVGVNSTEGKGSEFFVRLKRGVSHFTDSVMLDNADLPILPEKDQPEETAQDKIKIKLLIVEDNQDLREYLKMSLSHYYKTYSAATGKEAWDSIYAINPDIIVSDLNMPVMNGLELCRKVKTTYDTSHIPVILLTVMIDEKNVEAGLKIGADDYILKPFDVKYLRIKIDNIINNRQILRTKFLDIDKNALEEQDNSLNEKFIAKATQIINDHLTDTDFSISDLSKEMGMSRSLLYTKFNAVTGYSPNDFVKIIRMKKAIQLFREKKYSINEVAYMTGFGEPSYFTTCFKKIYGKAPKQFIDDEIR